MTSWHESRPAEEHHIVVAAWRERDEARAEITRLRKAIREHVDTVVPSNGSQPDYNQIAEACERLRNATLDKVT